MRFLWTFVAWLAWLGIYFALRRRVAARGNPQPIQWGWLALISAIVWGVTIYSELS